MRRLGIGSAITLACVVGACAAGDTAPGGHVAIGVAALSLPGVDNACYTLSIANQQGDVVWTRSGICADDYGDGAGSLSYVGTCDAATGAELNTVSLTVEGLYAAGGALIDPASYRDPTADGPVTQDVTCLPDADVAVTFDLTIARAANQGFFDVAVSFDDLFCSAKADCQDDQGQPLTLLHDASGQRAATAVLAFACTGGAGSDTALYLSDLVLDCGATTTTVDPSLGPGLLGTITGSGLPDAHLFDALVTRGDEQLGTYGKRYWTVALGLTDVAGCTLAATGTAADGGLTGGVTPVGSVWPYVAWDVDLDTCTRHELDGPDGVVSTRYTAASGASFAHAYSGAPALPGVCGDGVVEGAEACDDGAVNGTGGANASRTDVVAGSSGLALLLPFDGPAAAERLDDASAIDHVVANTVSAEDQSYEQGYFNSAATHSNQQAWQFYDDQVGTIGNVLGTTNQWYAVSLDSPRRITRFRVLPLASAGLTEFCPRHWRVDGSQDGSSWTKIPVASYGANTSPYNGDEVVEAVVADWAEVTLANSEHYRYYRLYIYDIVNGGAWGTSPIRELELIEEHPVELDVCDKVIGSASGRLSGADAVAVAPSASWSFAAGALSVAAWVKTSAGGPVVSYATSDDPSDLQLDLRVDRYSGQARFQALGSATGPAVSLVSPGSVANGAWHHLAATRDGDTWTLYVDGSAAASTTVAGTLAWSAAAELHVGRGAALERSDLTRLAHTLTASANMNPDGPIGNLTNHVTTDYANVLGTTNQWYAVTFAAPHEIDLVRVLPLSNATNHSPYHWRLDYLVNTAYALAPVIAYGQNATSYLSGEVQQTHVADWAEVTIDPSKRGAQYRFFIYDIINGANNWGTSPVRELELLGPERFARFGGRLDEVSVWRRALSAAEIGTLHAAQQPGAQSCGGSACTTSCTLVAP